VIKPVNLEALSKWVGNIPEDVVHDMANIAPMLSVLGYDPYANPPNYGSPENIVKENTWKVRNLEFIFSFFNSSRIGKNKNKNFLPR
jgi:protein-tyrosine sulfotransferase